MDTIVIIILVIVTIGLFPAFPYSRGWGYLPFATALIVLVMLVAWGLLERT
jgi:hypothetical protein